MTTQFWCLLGAATLPYVWATASAVLRKQEFGAIDAHHPRPQAAKQSGAGARAYAAQQNAFEALAMFAPAVLVAHLGNPASTLAPILALVWLGCRIGHGLVYMADVPPARTGLFAIGALSSVALFLVGLGVL